MENRNYYAKPFVVAVVAIPRYDTFGINGFAANLGNKSA